ncbi:MAG: hypothetical protein LC798_05860 [Chloroflexi bacterium]|nr:hypothetical protein [Chloroflexota bacterium]
MSIFEPDSDVVCGPMVPGAPHEGVLDVDEIQGAVIPGFGTSFQHLVALRFADAAGLRMWLAGPHAMPTSLAVTMAARNARRAALRREEPRPRTPVMRGTALSADALKLLRPEMVKFRDAAFNAGLAPRSTLIGDPADPAAPGHRSKWLFGGTRASTPHVLMILASEWSLDLDDAVAELAAAVSASGAQVLLDQRGHTLEGDAEHFGFRDGVSQIGIRGRLSDAPRHFVTRRWLDPADPLAITHARPGQPLAWPGQFVFGYEGADRDDPHGPPTVSTGGAGWMRNGSLLVLRRLRQDVAAFRAFIARESARLRTAPAGAEWTEERFAAALVGRWPDGSALVRTPDGPDQREAADMLVTNAFGYARPTALASVCADPLVAREGLAADRPPSELRTAAGAPADPDGLVCPHFAHIRKVNPRDLVTDQGDELVTRSLQMVRRGITWGEPYVEGEGPEAADRGLLFMSYQTSITDAFEFLSHGWMNRVIAPEGKGGHDLLVGQAGDAERRAQLPGGRPPLTTSERWVIPTGGGYFFSPSLGAVADLARE